MPSPVAVATIVAKPCLSFARVLAESFRRVHPDIPFYVLLADEVDGWFGPENEPFEMVRLDQLQLPDPRRFHFRYRQQELSFAATPYLIGHLLDRGHRAIGFLKQESLVLGDIGEVLELCERNAIVLTPHILEPLSTAAREMNILQSGVFNVGFIGVNDSPTARRFLAWWQQRVSHHARHEVAAGMHYEQRWLDFVPAYFENVHIIRDPRFNVGHWNLPERGVGDCRYIRFSGFDPDRPGAVTRYYDRLTLDNVGPAGELFRLYRGLLEQADHPTTRRWPYAFGCFDNGVPIPDIARQLFARHEQEFEDPFGSAFFRWLTQPAEDQPALSRLWREVYAQRADIRASFPDPIGRDADAMLHWARHFGAHEHNIAEALLPHGR